MEAPETAVSQTTRPGWLGVVGTVVAWACVASVEVFNLPNISGLAFLIPTFELLLWLGAGVLTLLLLGRARHQRLLPTAAVVGIVAVCVHFTNWAVFHPISYYAAHRYAFDAAAAGIRNGSIGSSDDYHGEALPWYLQDLSTNGRAAVVGYQDGVPAVLLPQWIGIPDDAGGYVFFDGQPRAGPLVDLFGAVADISAGIELGNGWWYVQPAD